MAKLPDASEIKSTEDKSIWEKIIVATPIVLTVVATILAGLSNSELNLAQYYRGLAAQMQSKVSDQWGYFQAKRIRAEQNDTSAQVLQSISQPMPFDSADLIAQGDRLIAQMKEVQTAAGTPESGTYLNRVESLVAQIHLAATQPDRADALKSFGRAETPRVPEQPIDDPQIKDLIRGLSAHVSDADLEREAGKIPQADLDKAIDIANANIAAYDAASASADKSHGEVQKIIDGLSEAALQFEHSTAPGGSLTGVCDTAAQITAVYTVARMKYNSSRYTADARYNQVLAELYEIQVRIDGFDSDRHRQRSKQFFYGMLGAQAGVTIATFALAVRRRSVLWSLAACAGFAAITFAAYVYVFV
jgi:hypothetical protein